LGDGPNSNVAESSGIQSSKPKVSLIVTSHNQIMYSQMMYSSLKKYTRYPYELVWVDCISTDGTREWLNSELHKETVKVFVPKIGIGEAMNIGFSKCSKESEYIGDLDNDLILTEGWLTRLIQHMEMDKKIAVCQALWSLRGKDPEKIHEFARTIKNNNGLKKMWWVNGSHTLFRRSALEQVGLWNPIYWMGEDKDIGIRLSNAGFKNVIALNTCVYHFQGRTTSVIEKTDPEWNKHRIESKRLLDKLYGSRKR